MLRACRRDVRRARRRLRRAQRRQERDRARLERLRRRARNVTPRRLQEAAQELADAELLVNVTSERLLVAQQRLRRVILEEYPPRRHEALRRKYLPGDAAERRPFSF